MAFSVLTGSGLSCILGGKRKQKALSPSPASLPHPPEKTVPGTQGASKGLAGGSIGKAKLLFPLLLDQIWSHGFTISTQNPLWFCFCLPSVRSGKGERAFLSLGDALELSAGLRCPSWGRGWEDMGQGALAPSVIWGPGVLSSAAGLTCEDKGTTRLAATTLCLRARLPAGACSFVLRVLFLGREQRCSQAAAAHRTRR